MTRAPSFAESLPDGESGQDDITTYITTLDLFLRLGKRTIYTTNAIKNMISRFDMWEELVQKGEGYLERIKNGCTMDLQKVFLTNLVECAWKIVVGILENAMGGYLRDYDAPPRNMQSLEGILYMLCERMILNEKEQAKVALDHAAQYLELNQIESFLMMFMEFTGSNFAEVIDKSGYPKRQEDVKSFFGKIAKSWDKTVKIIHRLDKQAQSSGVAIRSTKEEILQRLSEGTPTVEGDTESPPTEQQSQTYDISDDEEVSKLICLLISFNNGVTLLKGGREGIRIDGG